MLEQLEEDQWFSCLGSGNRCKYRTCPVNLDDIFEKGDQDQYSYHCRGEQFWIYADSSTIYNNSDVHIQYSTQNNKGYWVSEVSWQWHEDPHPIEFDTKTCPGRKFAGINHNCDRELFQIGKESSWDVCGKQSSVIYDGNVITLTSRSWEYKHTIYKRGAETNNPNSVTKPTFVSLLRCW